MDNIAEAKPNQNHLILGFFEFDFSPSIITSELGLEPLKQGIKGESYFIGHPNQIQKIHKYNMWLYEFKNISREYIGDQIHKFIVEIIEPRVDKINKLMIKGSVELRVVQYFYDGCNPQYYFKREDLKVLADINSSINMDLYCLGE